MLSSLIGAAVSALLFSFVAYGWLILLTRVRGLRLFVYAQLIGATITLVVAAGLLSQGFAVQHLCVTYFAVGLLGWIILWFHRSPHSGPSRSKFRLTWSRLGVATLLAVPGIVYSWLNSAELVKPGFTFRIGPDQFGWMTSAIQLCRGDTIATLAQRVQHQLGNTPLLESFNWPLLKTSFVQITQIPSFTDQVAAEFLIGANRKGLPGVLGAVCSLTGTPQMPSIYTGVAIWAVTMVVLLTYLFARDYSLPKPLSAVLGLAVGSSASILSVSLEGGFGQLVTLPFFLFLATTFVRAERSANEILLASTLLVSAAVATYLDVLFLALPFFGLLVLVLVLTKQLKGVRFRLVPSVLAVFVTIVATIPAWPDLWRLSIGPVLRPTAGGWDQGNVPFPTDLFGLHPWLPVQHGITMERTPLDFVLECALMLAILALIIMGGWKRNVITMVGLALYGYLMWSVYSQAEPFNNYRLWKFGMYAAVLLIFPLVFSLARYVSPLRDAIYAGEGRVPRASAKRTLAWVSVTLVLLGSLATSVSWDLDWSTSHTPQLPAAAQKTIHKLENKYDIVIVAAESKLYPVEFTAYGDARYVEPSRGYFLPTHRSNPPRPLVIITPVGYDCNLGCGRLFGGPQIVGTEKYLSTPWFDVFLTK